MVAGWLPPYCLDRNDSYLQQFHFSEDVFSPFVRNVDMILDSNTYYELGIEQMSTHSLHGIRKLRLLKTDLGITIAGQRPYLKRDHDLLGNPEAQDHVNHTQAVLDELGAVEVVRPRESLAGEGLTKEELDGLTRFFKLEGIGVEEETSKQPEEDLIARKMMEELTFFDPEKKRFVTDFLWRPGAKERLRSCEHRTKRLAEKNHERVVKRGLKKKVDAVFQEMIDIGYVEKIEDSQLYPTDHPYIYLDLFPVLAEQKETTKVRLVCQQRHEERRRSRL